MLTVKNAELETEKIREDLEKKAKEVEIRNDRIFKNQTVYKKGILLITRKLVKKKIMKRKKKIAIMKIKILILIIKAKK